MLLLDYLLLPVGKLNTLLLFETEKSRCSTRLKGRNFMFFEKQFHFDFFLCMSMGGAP